MKRFIMGNRISILFVLLQTILYVSFLTVDIIGGRVILSVTIKYSIIVICFCFALFQGKGTDKGINFCMKAALLFTVISDLFILVLDYYIYGVITFIVVQQLYGIRFIMNSSYADRKLILSKLTIRISVQILLTLTLCFLFTQTGVFLEALLIIGSFYFVCITTNTFTAIRAAIHHPSYLSGVLFAIGMGLFLMCDINVGIFNMSGFISMPERLYDLLYGMSSILMWTFYAPAQVLITLSMLNEK